MPERLNNVVPVYRPLRRIGGVQVYLHSFLAEVAGSISDSVIRIFH